MIRISFLSLLLILSLTIAAKCDHVIYKGETAFLTTFRSPLEKYPGVAELNEKLKDYHETCFDCFCGRYDAEWTIIDNELYLTNIYSCADTQPRIKADLNLLFSVNSGKVKADWVTDSLWIPKGKIVGSVDMMNVYDRELLIVVANGKVTGTRWFNYTNARRSNLEHDNEALKQFIYTRINWRSIPPLDQTKRVHVSFQSGESGRPENLKIMRATGVALYDDEAKRVIGLLPWSVYYMHGKIAKQEWTVPVIFSEEFRKKYADINFK